MRVAVMSKNKALREGMYLQIAAGRRHSRRSGSGAADAVLIDAGTGNVPDLTVQPDPAIPALVLLTPNARGSLEEMRGLGFAGYLVKPVRQSSLVTRLILSRRRCAGSRCRAKHAGAVLPGTTPVGSAGAGRSAAAGQPRRASRIIDAPDFDPPAIPAPFMEDHPPQRAASARHAARRPPKKACASCWPRTIPST